MQKVEWEKPERILTTSSPLYGTLYTKQGVGIADGWEEAFRRRFASMASLTKLYVSRVFYRNLYQD